MSALTLWKTWSKARYRRADLGAYIDEGSEIEGTYTFSGTVMLNGKFKGDIQSTDTLIVGERGVVNARISAGVVRIHGEVVGSVLATERVELRGHARVFGDLDAPIVVMDEGVLFEGQCRMTKAREDPVQRAWIAVDVPQCGYGQPGMIMAVAQFLRDHPAPTDDDIDANLTNLCRCATYARVRAAIHAAAGRRIG